MFDDDRIKHIFANRLKGLRQSIGLSQGELAEKLGVSRGSISYYENCSRVPDIVFLSRVSEYFGVGINFLLGHSENQNPKNEGLGAIIDFSDEAIKKLESGSAAQNYGMALSAIIEHRDFEKLFDIAEYFFMPLAYSGRPNYLDRCDPESEFEYYAFQVSRIFTSILLDLKNDVISFFYDSFANEFSKSDIERKQFLSDKLAHELAYSSYLAKKAEEWEIAEERRHEEEYEVWKASDEYRERLHIYQSVSSFRKEENGIKSDTNGNDKAN